MSRSFYFILFFYYSIPILLCVFPGEGSLWYILDLILGCIRPKYSGAPGFKENKGKNFSIVLSCALSTTLFCGKLMRQADAASWCSKLMRQAAEEPALSVRNRRNQHRKDCAGPAFSVASRALCAGVLALLVLSLLWWPAPIPWWHWWRGHWPLWGSWNWWFWCAWICPGTCLWCPLLWLWPADLAYRCPQEEFVCRSKRRFFSARYMFLWARGSSAYRSCQRSRKWNLIWSGVSTDFCRTESHRFWTESVFSRTHRWSGATRCRWLDYAAGWSPSAG